MRMSSFAEGLTSPEMEIVEGGSIVDIKTRFADLKTMLDSSKDTLKMDAMKRIINLVAKGRDVSELFPAVVKNVAAKNLELKKLVYVYLVRYAEEQQDLALLSISTFQRALKDPNQLIRASALRVLSSIRVPMIAPIMLLAIRESVRDMSAYVRKVAAHAIPKLYSLDEDLQTELIDCLDYLLGDKRTLVLGSAVYAFEETCPDRMDLLHKHFRSLCRAIADVDEWGQVVMIGLLTRYARCQFTNPTTTLDPDHVLLLSSCRPLLQSRNCAVVMAVAQLFYHCASPSQHPIISKALIRLLRGSREVQSIVLVNIATICSSNPNMFEPFLKSFFVRTSEPTHVKQLKLQILVSLVSETNVQLVLRELQTYVGITELASSAVEAIGQCALRVGTVADSCLSGLIGLISSPGEAVVSAVVVVLKKLLHSDAPSPLLIRVLRLIETVKTPSARACVIWLIAAHVEKVKQLAPDLLRIMAKSFVHENELVKLQTLNLAVKLWLTNREDCGLLVQYVIQLARFDHSYDVRDRCRLLKNIIFGNNKLSAYAKEIFMTEKPSPTVQSSFKDRDQFQLGSLSHLLNQRCSRYRDLQPFPEVASDPLIRNNPNYVPSNLTDDKQQPKHSSDNDDDFYSDEESESGEDDEDESESEENGVEDYSEEQSDAEAESEEEDESTEESESGEMEATDEGYAVQKRLAQTEETKYKDIDLLLDLNFDNVCISPYNTSSAKYNSTEYSPLLSQAAWPVTVSVEFKFARIPSSQSSSMCTITLKFRNCTDSPSPEISVSPLNSEGVRTSSKFFVPPIAPGCEKTEWIHIDFGDGKRISQWKLEAADCKTIISLSAPMGEQMEPIVMNQEEFSQAAKLLSGMNEYTAPLPSTIDSLQLYKIANCTAVTDSKVNFCGQTLSKKQLVLISLDGQISVRCDNVILASLLCRDIQESLRTV